MGKIYLMLRSTEPRHLRRCFVAPIPEMEAAASLLDLAVTALAEGRNDDAQELVQNADMPVLFDRGFKMMNGLDPVNLMYRAVVRGPVSVEHHDRSARMPSAGTERMIYERDGFRCRYCQCKVLLKSSRSAFNAMIPGAVNWPADREFGKHGAYYALNSCVDHVVPFSRGGDNSLDNLVTACWPCNFAKAHYLLEEVALSDPRERPPVVDAWDGLARLIRLAGPRSRWKNSSHGEPRPAENKRIKERIRRTGRKGDSSNTEAWLAGLDRIDAGTSTRLNAFLGRLPSDYVTWQINKALVVRLTVDGRVLDILGVNANGTVEVPWMLNGAKDHYKRFAITLAGAVPDAILYETPKMWRVKGAAGMLPVDALLEAEDAVREGLEQLIETLSTP